MKAYIGKYTKTGKLYLCVMSEGKTVKYHYIVKEDYPFLGEDKVERKTEPFEMRK